MFELELIQLASILQDNFDPEGSEFEPFTPNDWVEYPKFLDNIKDADFKQWASDLNSFWKKLGRKMKADVEVSACGNGVLRSNVSDFNLLSI